tara:strand:- start:1762 stop:2178 length:417 start_codon:yes stop_codon:yes gene_type:complete
MPILNSARRINPLDLNKNIRIGVAFPLDDKNMFTGTKTVKEQIKANLLNLLLTYPGERINLPNYGAGIKHLIFEQNIDLETLKIKIQSQIDIFIPDINIQNISTNTLKDKHTLIITITYNYILDNSTQSLQLNFNTFN